MFEYVFPVPARSELPNHYQSYGYIVGCCEVPCGSTTCYGQLIRRGRKPNSDVPEESIRTRSLPPVLAARVSAAGRNHPVSVSPAKLNVGDAAVPLAVVITPPPVVAETIPALEISNRWILLLPRQSHWHRH